MSQDKKSDDTALLPEPLVKPIDTPPIMILGGLVTTINHFEAVRIDVGSGIFVSVDRPGTSHNSFRLRILADRCFRIKRLSAVEVQDIIKTLAPRRPR